MMKTELSSQFKEFMKLRNIELVFIKKQELDRINRRTNNLIKINEKANYYYKELTKDVPRN